jgi:hypothetical protein
MFPRTSLATRGGPVRRARTQDAGRGRAFDAAGASGLAFLQSQLELIDPDIVEPLQAVTHARDIPVKVGGGFPQFITAWASNYASSGAGSFGLQGTNNTDIAQVQADVQKGAWNVHNWAAGMTITYLDLKRMEFALRTGQAPPFTLQELYEESCRTLWEKALDFIVYLGFLGDAGLINNAAVPEFTVANPGSGTTWAVKTPVQILNDVNTACNTVMANSGYDGAQAMPTDMLVPYTQYALLTQPMTIGGVPGYESAKAYIERNCVAAQHGVDFKINYLPNNWITGKGAAGSDRAVVYHKTDKSLYLKIPQPMTLGMTVPTTRAGGAYESIWYGCISQVIFKRTQTMIYADGV